MTVLPLVVAPDDRLLQPSEKVEKIDAALLKLMDDMLDTMYYHYGIGLAAVQVGVHKRVIVVDIAQREDRNKKEPVRMINPEILQSSEALSSYNEGCLSFPDQYSDVERPADITIRYMDEKGETKTLQASGVLATCIQHEIDHTNGIVFVDHISKMKRDMIIRKLKKAKKQGIFDPSMIA